MMGKPERLLCLVVFLLGGCEVRDVSNVGRPEVAMRADALDRPFVFMELFPAYSSHPVAGLLLAIWSDGRILRVRSEAEIGKAYVRGRLAPEQIKQARDALGRSGILTTSDEDRGSIMDASSEELTVRWGDAARMWHHNPGNENTNNADATDPRITQLRHELLALPMAEVVSEPAESPWIPPEWRR